MLKFTRSVKKGRGQYSYDDAPDIHTKIIILLKKCEADWINPQRIFCVRSINANTRAYARIWGLAKIWQKTLNISPSYIIEVISEKFDKVISLEQDKILIHEICHIPRNFSGSLLPHIRRGRNSFSKKVSTLINQYANNSNTRK